MNLILNPNNDYFEYILQYLSSMDLYNLKHVSLIQYNNRKITYPNVVCYENIKCDICFLKKSNSGETKDYYELLNYCESNKNIHNKSKCMHEHIINGKRKINMHSYDINIIKYYIKNEDNILNINFNTILYSFIKSKNIKGLKEVCDFLYIYYNDDTYVFIHVDQKYKIYIWKNYKTFDLDNNFDLLTKKEIYEIICMLKKEKNIILSFLLCNYIVRKNTIKKNKFIWDFIKENAKIHFTIDIVMYYYNKMTCDTFIEMCDSFKKNKMKIEKDKMIKRLYCIHKDIFFDHEYDFSLSYEMSHIWVFGHSPYPKNKKEFLYHDLVYNNFDNIFYFDF